MKMKFPTGIEIEGETEEEMNIMMEQLNKSHIPLHIESSVESAY